MCPVPLLSCFMAFSHTSLVFVCPPSLGWWTRTKTVVCGNHFIVTSYQLKFTGYTRIVHVVTKFCFWQQIYNLTLVLLFWFLIGCLFALNLGNVVRVSDILEFLFSDTCIYHLLLCDLIILAVQLPFSLVRVYHIWLVQTTIQNHLETVQVTIAIVCWILFSLYCVLMRDPWF